MRLLFVCTGNICRSPVAERLIATQVPTELLASGTVVVGSAGTNAVVGSAIDPNSAAALSALGGDPTDFSARLFMASMAEEADLVLTATRRQRTRVLQAAPRTLRRTFTICEAADLIRYADLTALTSSRVDERIGKLAARLDAARALRASRSDDDIADPVGQSYEVHLAVAQRIARSLAPLLGLLFEGTSSGEPAEKRHIRDALRA
jgi:protein-tyrosine phosphatase